jgi:hypothetical protein
MFEISNEANAQEVWIGVSFRSCINCAEFFMLKGLGRGVNLFNFCENVFVSLYAGAFHQFTAGQISWSGL